MKISLPIKAAAAMLAAVITAAPVSADNSDPENKAKRKVYFSEQSFINRISTQSSTAKQVMKFKTMDDPDSLDKNIKDMNWLKENREPPYIPDLSEIEFSDGSESSITAMWKALKEVTFHHNEITETLERLKKDEIPKVHIAMNSVYSFLDQQNEFLTNMSAYDRGIQKCLDMAGDIPSADPKRYANGNQMLIDAKLDSIWHTVYFNKVQVVQSQIRPFNVDPRYKDLDKRIKDYIFVFKNNKRLVNEWYAVYASKTVAADKFAVMQQAYAEFLDKIVSELEKTAALYESRLDTGTVHGKIITGKIDFPYDNVKLNTGEGGAVIYPNPYLKAASECINAFNNGWKKRTKDDPDALNYYQQLK